MDRILIDYSREISNALNERQAVLALESTIISHGMPYPANVHTAMRAERIARNEGVIPATIAILNGRLKIGLSHDEIDDLGRLGYKAIKTSRRDIPLLIASGDSGATTVAATMAIASLAGIRVFATGGIGGVHRGAAQSFDISADLEELARTETAVVCAGVKSILDIGLTLEYLETKGVPLLGYRTTELPGFYTPSSGFKVDRCIDTPEDAAAIMHTQWSLGLGGGMLITQAVPEEYGIEKNTIETAINTALETATQQGITGKDITPFLLSSITKLTRGKSLDANIALFENNVRLGAKIARAYSKLSAP